MKMEDETTKLFDEIWNEPMTTVVKRYGLSDNGLRKRCLNLGIPVPPRGYWAKLKAGQEVPPKPTLPAIKVETPTIALKDKKQERKIEFIDIGNQSTEVLKSLNGMRVLTRQSQEEFVIWCKKIQVSSKVDSYHPLILEYQKEFEYRKARDKEHKFRDRLRFSAVSLNSKVEYRDDKLVLPICVSDKQNNRAFRIVDTLVKAVEDLGGKITVEKSHYRSFGAKDNATITVFESSFSFQIKEMMVKWREILSNMPEEKKSREFRPLYEKVFAGILEIELKQALPSWGDDKTGRVFRFMDSTDLSLEDQVGEIIKSMFSAAQEAKIDRIIKEREEEDKRRERQRQHAIEIEKQNKLQALIAEEKRQTQLIANIEQQMDDWFKVQRLRQYAEELEAYALATDDETNRELLSAYIVLVRKKVESFDPIAAILNEVKPIGFKVQNEDKENNL
ncbi:MULTISPECIES: hypothetical protein [Sporomusa]|uniref:hypothetical protein n=1 Tax=Sporomusa TaxID=2375 RepID=UPI003159346C